MVSKRGGLVVWVSDIKSARNLEKIGNIIYISRRLNYVLLYVNESEIEEKISYINNLHFVNKVERSYRSEMNYKFPSKS